MWNDISIMGCSQNLKSRGKAGPVYSVKDACADAFTERSFNSWPLDDTQNSLVSLGMTNTKFIGTKQALAHEKPLVTASRKVPH